MSECVDKRPVKKRDMQQSRQGCSRGCSLLPPAAHWLIPAQGWQLPPVTPEPVCLKAPHPDLNFIFLAACLIKESSFHVSISVTVQAIQ